MNQHYWSSVQSAFLREHYRTGISAKRWVICRGLKWSSAKRHIKVEAQTLMNATTPENSQIMRNSHQCAKVANDAQSGKNAGCSGENLENKITKSGGETKQPRKRGAPFGNSNATKHGGYTKFWRRPIKEWALHKSLNDINDDDGLI
ncbi:MAG: hypothetical protein HRT35_19920, partial [Algicola sp.]|nr:hypothetical protein [Algicola sp.]